MKITLEAYQRYDKQLLKAQEQERNIEDYEVLKAFLGQDDKTINALPEKFISQSLEDIYKFLSKETYDFKPIIKHNGITYGFIPNLDSITYGENTDLVRYISNWETMHKAMSVMYRPIKKNWLGRVKTSNGQYNIEKYTGTSNANDFLDVDADIVLGATVFFYNLTNELVRAIPNYLEKQVMNQELMSSLPNGESMQSYIDSLKETLQSLKL